MAEKYTKDVAVQGAARIIGGGLSFAAVFVLTYLFDEGQLGQYNLILSSVNVATSVFTLWLSQGILRYYRGKTDLGFVTIATLLSGALCLIAFFVFTRFAGQTVSVHGYVYLFSLVLYNILDALFRKERRLLSYAALELLLALGRLFPMALIAAATKDYNAVFISQYLILFAYILFLLVKQRPLKGVRPELDRNRLGEYLRFGLPLLGLSVSNWFLTSSDRYIIRFFENDASVGIYSTNYSLANSIYMMFALILINAYHPIIVKEWDADREKGKALVSKVLNEYVIFVTPLVFYGCLKAPLLLSLFRGDAYRRYSDVFVWTVLGIFVYGLSLLYHKYYELTKNTKRILIYNLLSAGLNILLNFLMIPRFGFSAAAFTTFLAYVGYLALVRASTFRVFPVGFSWKTAARVVLPIALFFAGDWLLPLPDSIPVFFLEGILFVLYIAAAYQLLGVMDFRTLRKRRADGEK